MALRRTAGLAAVALLAGAAPLVHCGRAASGDVSVTAPRAPSGERGSSAGGVGTARPEPAAGAPAKCETSTRARCLETPGCTLVHAPKPPRMDLYACRPSEPKCEAAVPQRELMRDRAAGRTACEQRAGCRYQGGGCYCHCRGYGQTAVPDGPEAESCNCACSGGPPPVCAPATAGR